MALKLLGLATAGPCPAALEIAEACVKNCQPRAESLSGLKQNSNQRDAPRVDAVLP